ncbi:glycosyl transferase [Hymenobacter sp. J193]|uniref:glycosyltransferase family protein n=1 Tax=Hymenobacter sp. J193 TaxID=2898429 RepID=UPI00215125D7|nr:glycosyltransferase family protein [Hymenobacter sp. J193]MCR5889863.1 glycosyl transferase [Hymenobacter sp. J193]
MPRILYAIQGTGNGHLARSLDIVPLLQERASHLDVLISGPPSDIQLPYPVRYRCHGMGFIFGKSGGISFSKTFAQLNAPALLRQTRELPVKDYDLVINDFEPVSAWACWLRQVPCVALSHQSAVLGPQAPRPRRPDPVGHAVLRHYAPSTAHYGFHFERYDEHTFTPVIRRQVRELTPQNDGHYTVYLPAYDEETLVSRLRHISRDVAWEVFSKHSQQESQHGNVRVRPVSGTAFTDSLARSAGVFCGAGFETPAEALYLGKKLLVVPMKNQYEQACNAASLAHLGVPVVKSLKDKHLTGVEEWLRFGRPIPVDYPDETGRIIDRLLMEQLGRKRH